MKKLNKFFLLAASLLITFNLFAQSYSAGKYGEMTDTHRTSEKMGVKVQLVDKKPVDYRTMNPSKNSAVIILEAGDVWGDGSGYQLLLDATATQYGVSIPVTGYSFTSNCDIPADLYDVFSHTVPANAEPSCTTSNMVLNDMKSIEIPAGVYDWVLVNPVPGEKIFIASDEGEPGRADNYTFEAGVSYHFSVIVDPVTDNTDYLIIDTEVVDTEFPSAPTNFTVTPDPNEGVFANISWINPTTTIDGTATTLTSATLKRNGEIIHTVDNPSGTSTFQDNTVPSAGLYTYELYVSNAAGNSETLSKTVTIGATYQMVLGQTLEITACSGVIYDNGGPEGNYLNNSNDIMIIRPATEGANVGIEGTFVIESNYDFLYVYDGAGTEGNNLLATYTSSNGGTIEAASTAGALTLHFTSDGNVPKAGFEIALSCSSATSVSGKITELATGNPVPGAKVYFNGVGGGYTLSDSNGNYNITLLAGTFDVEVVKDGYNIVTESSVVVTENGISDKNYQLTAPVMSLNVSSLNMDCLPGATDVEEIVISNTGDGVLTWNIVPEYSAKGMDSQVIYAIDKTMYTSTLENIGSGESFATGEFFMNSATYMHGIFYFATLTEGLFGTIDPEEGKIVEISRNNPFSCVAYNPADGILYGMTTGSYPKFFNIDPETAIATEIKQLNAENYFLGFCFDNNGRCFAIDASINGISEVNINTGAITTVATPGAYVNAGQDIDVDRETNTVYWAACGGGNYPLYKVDVENNDLEIVKMLNSQTSCFAIATNYGWLDIEPQKGVLEPGESQTITFTTDGNWANEGTFNAVANFKTSNPNIGTTPVNVTFIIGVVSVDEMNKDNYSIYPNPATNQVTVKGDNIERVSIYNIVGECIEIFDVVDGNNVNIQLDNYSNGTYMLNIYTKDGYNISKPLIIVE